MDEHKAEKSLANHPLQLSKARTVQWWCKPPPTTARSFQRHAGRECSVPKSCCGSTCREAPESDACYQAAPTRAVYQDPLEPSCVSLVVMELPPKLEELPVGVRSQRDEVAATVVTVWAAQQVSHRDPLCDRSDARHVSTMSWSWLCATQRSKGALVFGSDPR